MNATIPIWGAILVAIIGGCVGALATGLFVRLNNKTTRRAAAFSAFRAVVLSELGSVYPKPVNWPANVDAFFKAHFDALQVAVENVRPFVADGIGFERAWVKYYNAYPNKTNEQCYHHYSSAHDPYVGTQEMANAKCRAELHKNVSNLLSFTRET